MGKNMKLSHKQKEIASCANSSLLGKQGRCAFSACTVTGAHRWLALLRWTEESEAA